MLRTSNIINAFVTLLAIGNKVHGTDETQAMRTVQGTRRAL